LAKKYKEAVINEGKDPDAYLDDAFEDGDYSSSQEESD